MTAPTTGRAAWNARGGTLTLGGKPGYYAYVSGQPVVGSAGIHAPDLDHRAVAWGVLAIQAALNWYAEKAVAATDGRYGPSTAQAVAAFQQAQHTYPFTDTLHPADPPGAVGKGTAYRLFAPVLTAYCQAQKVPPGLAHGIVELESAWDPGAVGFSTPQDEGLAQWRTPMAHDGQEVDEAYAFGLFSSLRLLAESLEDAFTATGSWPLAVMAHHAPAWSGKFAKALVPLLADPDLANEWRYLNVVLNHVS